MTIKKNFYLIKRQTVICLLFSFLFAKFTSALPITEEMIQRARAGSEDRTKHWDFLEKKLVALKNNNERVNIDEENRDNESYTALHYAAALGGNTDITQALLDRGANVNVKNEKYNRKTPLHIAAKHGHLEIVKILLNAKANKEERGRYGETALHSAVCRGNKTIVELLLNAGANVNATDKDGNTPLHAAVEKGYKGIVTALLQANANKNAQDKDGNTPLHIAAKNNFRPIIKILLNAGANKDARNNKDKPYVFYAAKQKGDINAQYELALLYNSGAMHVEPWKKYLKSIYWAKKAAEGGHKEAIKLLDELNKKDINNIKREQAYIDEQKRIYLDQQHKEEQQKKEQLQKEQKTVKKVVIKEAKPSVKERKKESRVKAEEARKKAQLEAKENKKKTKEK